MSSGPPLAAAKGSLRAAHWADQRAAQKAAQWVGHWDASMAVRWAYEKAARTAGCSAAHWGVRLAVSKANCWAGLLVCCLVYAMAAKSV